MLNITEFDSMVSEHLDDSMTDKHLDDVTLEPYNSTGTIPLFEDTAPELTHEVVRAFFESICLYDKTTTLKDFNDSMTRNYVYKLAEIYVKLGALAAYFDNLTELFSGMGLPSQIFSRIKGRPATIVDKEERQIEIAKSSAERIGVDLECVVGRVEENPARGFIRNLNKNNIVIYCGSSGKYLDYSRELIDKLGVTLLFTSRIISEEPRYAANVRDHTLKRYVQRNFHEHGNYDVTIGLCNNAYNQFVFLVKRGS